MSDLFDFRAPKNQYAVMGNPVAHSRSPIIHQMFGQQCNVQLDYTRIQVDAGGFEQAVSHFAAHDGAGLNITVPFKVDAFNLCKRSPNQLSERANVAESVNTLQFLENGEVYGDNTDGIGFVRDIENNHGIRLARKKILVIGAGGAVRGILGPMLDSAPAKVHIVNRTAEKATVLARRFDHKGSCQIVATGLDRIEDTYDLIINGTASSLTGELPDVDSSCVGTETVAYDMMYGSEPTVFMNWALSHGAQQAHDGLGMLVEQAAESFRIWHGLLPETKPIISYLRKI